MLSFYSVKLNSFQLQLFNNITSNLSNEEFKDYYPQNFTNLNLNELATKAKDNQLAKEEILFRIMPRVTSIVKKYCMSYQIKNYNELLHFALEGISGIINSYDKTKGNFVNFLSRSINRVLYFRVIKIFKEENMKTRYLGYKAKEIEEEKYQNLQTLDPNPKEVAYKVDLQKYISQLKVRERKLILLFLKGYTISEIANFTKYSIASVSIKIRKIIDKLKKEL